jgi:hypothetical protein
MFVARIRYGSENDKGFICKEFILPSQLADFKNAKGLPPIQQKCLLCSRYWLNYTYILARTDSNFKLPKGTTLQNFTNKACGLPKNCTIDQPTHCSLVSCKDGYYSHAMLFVDEEFANRSIQRETNLCSLSFYPVVRFCSTHYRYVVDSDGGKRIVQVGIGYEDNLDGLGFQQPLSRGVTARAANMPAC